MSTSDAEEPSPTLGARLAAARQAAGLSLAQVAEKTGVSASFISAVERGKSDIAISRLMRLVSCYGVSISDLVEDETPGLLHVVRGAERKALRLAGEHIAVYALAPHGEHAMMPVLNEYAVGGGMSDPATHAGEEFIYVLEGSLELSMESEAPVLLRPGDSAYYRAERPHSFRNVGEEVTRFVGVVTPPNL
jgi:transcriptional regulator with XRE-family HTH domain